MMPIVFGAKAAGVEAAELTRLAAVYPGDAELDEPWVHRRTPAASAASKGKARFVVCSCHKQTAWEGMKFSPQLMPLRLVPYSRSPAAEPSGRPW